MKYILSVLAILSGVTGFAQREIVSDQNAVVRAITGSFRSISVSSGINLFLSPGDEPAIAVSASAEKYINGIKTMLENGDLHIYYDGDRFLSRENVKLNVYVAYKELETISASGASDLYIAGTVSLPALTLKLSGASFLKGDVNIGDLTVKLGGASDLLLTGSAKNLNIESTGASDVKGYGFSVENCNVRATGASDVDITITVELSAEAHGASEVHYKGSGTIKSQQSTGGSSIAHVD